MFRRKRHWAQALLFEEEDLTQEQGFFRKLNAYTAAPGIAGFAVLVYMFAIILIVRFVTVHWLQVLMIAPIAAALWQLYRMKKADRPDWQRYPKALAALDQGRAREAALALAELAHRGYIRAQYTLAGLYATGRGVLKDPQRATHWLAQAAARGHAHALCELAARHLDGRGVPQDVQKALDCYRRAAAKGIAQAAFSLGYLHETGRADQKRDKESAAQWYYQAGVLSLKDRDLKGAQSALQALNALQADHPLSRKLLEAEPELAGG